jgi:methyl-accepting chemotaxis protein
MKELDQVTQQNAAMFEETSAASVSLSNEATALNAAVSRFRIGDHRPAAPVVTAPAAAERQVVGGAPVTDDRGGGWTEF